MAIIHIFNFDTAQYRSRIATLSDAALQRSEATKLRQENGAVASGLGGVFLAPLTGGVSLIGSVYGTRRYSIASQKLQIVQKELDARTLARHVLSDRDQMRPDATRSFQYCPRALVSAQALMLGKSWTRRLGTFLTISLFIMQLKQRHKRLRTRV
jgi:hypothetical protein